MGMNEKIQQALSNATNDIPTRHYDIVKINESQAIEMVNNIVWSRDGKFSPIETINQWVRIGLIKMNYED